MGRRFDPDGAHSNVARKELRALSRELKIRFRDFINDDSKIILREFMSIVYGREFREIIDPDVKVDLEITGPYGGGSDDYKSPLSKRIARGFLSQVSNGSQISIPWLATGINPNPRAAANIWYTGENKRPPFGEWDAYLSFDTKLPDQRNIYFPLWFMTSTDMFSKVKKSYWGRSNPTIQELMSSRTKLLSRKKFACAFIGKNYPQRLHALSILKKIGRVDVFGSGARNHVEHPWQIAKDYQFVMCFENDLYPGYITEKPFEAYLSGAIPLYFGLDSEKFLNNQAILNLADYKDTETWMTRIEVLHHDEAEYSNTYEQPLLARKPDLNSIVETLRTLLPNV